MSLERMKVLDMLANGKINPQEANDLIAALEQEDAPEAAKGSVNHLPKFLCVKVTPKKAGGDKVNIRIPLQILRSGIKLASLMPGDVSGKVNDALHDKGFKIDIEKVKPEQLDEVITALSEMSIDVDGEDETVKICCE